MCWKNLRTLAKGPGSKSIALQAHSQALEAPGENKELNAAFAAKDPDGATPVADVGGWNIAGQI
jgi:hypothetical protein